MLDYKTIDAFTDKPFGGNPAGVVIIDGQYPEDEAMLQTAKRAGYSETAFVRPGKDRSVELRYFTPAAEVDLCGHATIASFFELWKQGLVESGKTYKAITKAGEINVDVDESGSVWMDMAPPRELGGLDDEDLAALYAAYGLNPEDAGPLPPAIVSTGLPDIIMPVKDAGLLAALKPDMEAISRLSEKLCVTGVHVFAPGQDGVTARARNFAPLYDIPEEAATGTANGALCYYLYNRKLIKAGEPQLIIQGEAMGRPSKIRAIVLKDGSDVKLRVGGQAAARE